MNAGSAWVDDSRRVEQLAGNLATVRDRIASACPASGRTPDEITIVAITKTWPASDVRILAGLGIRHVGENRDQEARPKVQQCSDLELVWHFVGQLQRNKAASVAGYADVVESVDRAPLVLALERAAARLGRRLAVCVQVDLGEDVPDSKQPSTGAGAGAAAGAGVPRGGVHPDGLLELAALVAGTEHLDLAGVMAVAPLGVDPTGPFEQLAALHERLLLEHPAATMRSAGMSADLEAAVAAGATHVRLGSALLGHRPA